MMTTLSTRAPRCPEGVSAGLANDAKSNGVTEFPPVNGPDGCDNDGNDMKADHQGKKQKTDQDKYQDITEDQVKSNAQLKIQYFTPLPVNVG